MALARSTQIILGSLLVGAVVVLVATDDPSGRLEYMQVHELLEQSGSLQGEEIQVHGTVVPGTVMRKAGGDQVEYRFEVEFGGKKLAVRHLNMVPDTFQEKGEVVLTGSLGADQVFVSRDMTAKCPSKYEKTGAKEHPGSIPRGPAAKKAGAPAPAES